MIQDISLRINPTEAADRKRLMSLAAKSIGCAAEDIHDMRIIRRSIDARQRQVMVNITLRVAACDDMEVCPLLQPVDFRPVKEDAPRVVIVGAGPAGLFAALEAIRLGIRPVVLERGADVDTRRRDLAMISREGKINPRSNYCFGEGGAGAYSDGKLFTRSKKRGNIEAVLQLFVQHGASETILIDAHPHIGSDRLPHVIKNIRQTILNNGGEVRFGAHVDSLLIDEEKAVGVTVGNEKIEADAVILATGHSAHDTFREVHRAGVKIEPKGIAVGVRLEHPQQLIDRLQYHSEEGRGKYLPAAEYSFVTQADGRGVYSFCMCPGGVIVPAGSAENELVVNGMSASARAGKWANSGMVVEIRPGDFSEYKNQGPFEMLALQEHLERKFFDESGESINAPAQRMKDFTEGKISKTLPETSYAPGIHPADFSGLFPAFISERLKKGFLDFGRKHRGFLTNEACMIGLESRTSSPVRITRDRDSLESENTLRLYPAGEGAGYAGGIVSAAVDGIRCIDSFFDKYVKGQESNGNE